jgi:hypothetical protein
MSCQEKKSLAVEFSNLTVPADAQWSEPVTVSFINSHVPRIYYFAVMDCDHVTQMAYRAMPKIEVDFNIVNQPSDGDPVDHFSYEEQGSLGLYIILLLTFAPLLAFSIYKCVEH